MAGVQRLTKQLSRWGSVPRACPAAVAVRPYRDAADARRWLKLHARAFPTSHPRARRWQWRDFQREFLSQAWWSSTRMWLAEYGKTPTPSGLVGAVCLMPCGRQLRVGAVHWLMVAPDWRRRGVASHLLHQLECQAVRLGYESLRAETLTTWHAAVCLYQAAGYTAEAGKSA